MNTKCNLVAGACIVALLPTAACDRAAPTAPDRPAPDLAAAADLATLDANSVIDIGGEWTWSETSKLTMDEATAADFGIQPEGPRTIVNCESGGIMTIVQTGAEFTGSATQSSLCETNGGHVFVPPVFPPFLPISEGRIRGRSIEFVFGGFPISCPYRGSVQAEAGVGVAMSGPGKCITPGHPQNPLPVPPPPQGPGPIHWQATR